MPRLCAMLGICGGAFQASMAEPVQVERRIEPDPNGTPSIAI